MKGEHVAWSKALFQHIRDGGCWGVPRSGLVFRRVGKKLILTSRMEDSTEPAYTLGRQLEDFKLIQQHMGAAGIPVEDGIGLEVLSEAN